MAAYSARFNLLHEFLKAAGEARPRFPKVQGSPIGPYSNVGCSILIVDNAILGVALLVLEVRLGLPVRGGWVHARPPESVSFFGFVALVKITPITANPSLNLSISLPPDLASAISDY